MKDLNINIVNSHELDPNKKYILVLPNESYSIEDAKNIADNMSLYHIKGIILIRRGNEEIKVIEAR